MKLELLNKGINYQYRRDGDERYALHTKRKTEIHFSGVYEIGWDGF